MRWKPLIILHVIAILLFFSWLLPYTSGFWETIDIQTFKFLNESLVGRPLVQIFWALANVRLTDLLAALFMASFILLFILDGKDEHERRLRLNRMIFLCLWGEIGILLSKEVIDYVIHKLEYTRESPTVFYRDSVMLSQVAPWLKVKDFSYSCFPGDHAEILLQWAIFITYFTNYRYSILAWLASLFFIMPRLIGGAHWVSDAVVGGASVALIVFAWSIYSPLYSYGMHIADWIASKIVRVFPKLIKAGRAQYDRTTGL